MPIVWYQALIIIMVEKFFLKIPRVAGKIERFYINIVEGKTFRIYAKLSIFVSVTASFLYKYL
jgi:hypothetical protein